MANTKLPARLLDTSAIPALNVTGDLTVDTTTLKVDSTNNRIGIGVASPTYSLDVGHTLAGNIQARFKSSGGSGYTQGAIVIESSDSTDAPASRGQGVYMFNHGVDKTWYAGTLYSNPSSYGIGVVGGSTLQTSAADDGSSLALVIDQNRNVGIGTSNPGAVRLYSTTAASGNLAGFFFNSHATGSYGVKIQAGSDSSNYGFVVTNKDNANPTQFYVRGDGNVGINTNSPGQKLDVVGTIQSSVGLRVAGHPVVGYSSITGGYAADLGSTGTSTLNETHIYAGGNRRVVIDGSGSVGIGTDDPTNKLHVRNASSGGTATTNSVAVFEDNDNTEVSILGGTSSLLALNFGSSGNNDEMSIKANTTSSSRYLQFDVSTTPIARLDAEGFHFQKADGQKITAKESIIMVIDDDNNTASRVFQVRDGNSNVLLNLHDDYRMEVGTIQHAATRTAGYGQSNGLGASAGDWVDVATVPYGRNIATIKLYWDGIYAPSSSHHGNMEFDIGSHYGTSYYYGWDSYINLKASSAHNAFNITEARIITPGGSGATGYFQVKFGAATGTQGIFRSYVTHRDESCTISPMTPAVNNSRSGTTIASIRLGTDQGRVANRVGLATSRDMHIGGGLTVLNQTGFNAYSPAVTTSNNVVVFGSARHNVGGAYSTSTGRFTATTAGKHFFTTDILMKPTSSGHYGRILFRVNGVGGTMEQYGDTLTIVDWQPNYFSLGLSCIISMNVGDCKPIKKSGK